MPKDSKKVPCIIAIDIGTTAIKFVVFDLALKELFLSEQPIKTFRNKPGHSEQDAEAIFHSIYKELALIAKQFPSSIALCFSSAMHSLLAVDQAGNAQTKAMIWSDMRSKEAAKKLRNSPEGKVIYRATGTPIHPMSPLCKLLWWKSHHATQLKQVYKFVSIKEYVLFKLTGQFVIDYGMASATGLFEPTNLDWHAKSLELLEVSKNQLSHIISPKKELSLKKEVADDLGFSNTLKVFSGSSDGCLANLGDGATQPGVYAVSIGTSGAVRTLSPNFETDSEMRLFSYMLDKEKFVHGGAVNNGGIVLEWLGKFLDEENPLSPEQINSLAQASEAGAGGLLFLPYLQGERAPFWNPDMQGGFVGLNFSHTQRHLARAVMEGVLYNIYYVMQSVAQLHPSPKLIKASGGFTKSTFWLQMLADIAQCKVEVNEGMLSAARGAAMLVLEAMEIDFVPQSNTQDLQVFEPEPNRGKVYQNNFSRFSEELARLAEI